MAAILAWLGFFFGVILTLIGMFLFVTNPITQPGAVLACALAALWVGVIGKMIATGT